MVFGRRKPSSPSSSNDVDTIHRSTQVHDNNNNDDDDDDDSDGEDDDDNEGGKEQSPKRPATSASSSSFSFPVSSNVTDSYKFGIMERLNDAVAMKVATSTAASYRSPDLIPLMKSFDIMRKKLRQMIITCKQYHQSMITLDNDRVQMAKEVALFADGTPMKDKVNKVDDPLSFIGVFHNASNISAKNSFKYKTEVLAYCVEWEAVVLSRVDKDVQDIKKLREMFNHYQDKVDSLRRKVNGQETKGKSINAALSEKVQRNEEKLDEASGLYESSARPLCVLIEEVVQYGFKDLYLFIVAIMKFEMERSQNESRALHLFQCDAFESEFGPKMSLNVARNTVRPTSSNGRNKSQERSPQKVLNKKLGTTTLSNDTSVMRSKSNKSTTKSNNADKPKREPAFTSNGNLDSAGSESVTDDILRAKVDAV